MTRERLLDFAVRVALVVPFLTACGGCSSLEGVDLGRVVTSGRDGWQHPERVIDALQIQPGDRVAEIGAGKGYWLPRLSESVGPGGVVYAVEVEADLASALERRVEDDGLGNVVVILGDYDDPKLPDGEIDLAITCLTYHHIEDRAAYFSRLRVDLAQDGRVAHLDDRDDVGAPIRWFQGNGHWMNPDTIQTEMRDAGYRRVTAYDFLPAQSFQVFEPDAPPSGRAAVADSKSAGAFH